MPHLEQEHHVDCRIGSLENQRFDFAYIRGVDCRIGSLEIAVSIPLVMLLVDCRIGSLESKEFV